MVVDKKTVFRIALSFVLTLFYWPFGILLAIELISLYGKFRKAKKVDGMRSEVAKKIGDSKFIHVEKDTAIALNLGQKEILLGKPGLMKKYTYADIREWAVKEQTAGEAVGVGFVSSVAAAGANSRAQQAATANTGLFIRVKDIDHPEWRVSMFEKDDRNRWFEILTQEVNEGGIAA